MDLKTLNLEELAAYRLEILVEYERRANLTAIPIQITALATTYFAAGGTQSILTAAVTPAVKAY